MAVLDGYGGRMQNNLDNPTGSPVVKGTAVEANVIAFHILDGIAWQVILRRFPEITKDDIRACLEYAADECQRVREMVVPGGEN